LIALKAFHLIGSKIIGSLIFVVFFPAMVVGWLAGRGEDGMPRWKIILIYVISVVLIVFLISFKGFAGNLNDLSLDSRKNSSAKGVVVDSVDKQLAQAAEINSKKLPMLISNEIRLDRNITEPGRLVYYFYTLMAIKSSGLDANRAQQLLRRPHLDEFCNAPDMGTFRDNNVKMVYVYSGSDGVEITRIRLSTADCKS
jgi:hypothetical protein